MDPKHGVTEDELEGLSDEERAALEDEGDDGNDGKPAGDPPADPPADDKEAKPADGAADDAPPADEGDTPFAVPFHHDAKVKPEEAKARLDTLQKQFDDGEIDMPTFLAQRDGVMAAVIEDRVATNISAKSQEQTAIALWQRARDEFLDDHEAYKDPVLYDALDARVKALASDPENDKLSDKQLLNKAHQEVAARFKVADTPTPAVDPKKALADKRKPNLKDVPPNIAGIPAAAENVAADDEFADLDKLATQDTALYEQRLAKLTPEQQARYLGVTS